MGSKRRLALAVGVSVIALAMACPGTALAILPGSHVRIVNRIELSFGGGEFPAVRASLSVALPAREPLVRDLLDEHRPADESRRALRWLLNGLGTFRGTEGDTSPAFALPFSDVVPVAHVTIRGARAHIWLELGTRLFSNARLDVGLWSVTLRHDRLIVESHPEKPRRRFTLLQIVSVDGAAHGSLRPVPDRDHVGQPLRWRGFEAIRAEIIAPRASRWLIDINDGEGRIAQGFAYVLLAVLFPALVLAGVLRRRSRLRARTEDDHERSLRRTAWRITLIGAVVAVSSGFNALRVDWQPRDDVVYGWLTAGALVIPVVAAAVAFAWSARVARTGRAWAATFGLVAVGGAVVLAIGQPSLAPRLRLDLGDALGPLSVAVLAATLIMSFAALASSTLRMWPARQSFRWTAAVVLGASLALIGEWLDACHVLVERSDEQVRLSYQTSSPDLGGYLAHDLVDYFGNFGFYIVDLVQAVLLCAVLSDLRRRSRTSAHVSPSSETRTLLILLFATFVGGSYGSLLGFGTPIAFAVAWIALATALAFRRDADPQPPAASAARRLRLGLRALTQLRPTSRDREPGMRGSLGTGPGETWWDRAVIASRCGAVIAIVPALHYVWVVVDLSDPFSAGYSLGGADVLVLVLVECAFWVVGAFTFGALYPCIPGTTGFLKGLTPAACFALSQAAVEILPGPFDSLSWPFLAVEVGLYFVLLGVALDYVKVLEAGERLSDLLRHYAVDRLVPLLGYALPVAVALFFFLQQLVSGNAQQAVAGLLEAATGQSPAAGTSVR